MAVLKYEENGQAYFEWLQELTSEEYVNAVKDVIKDTLDFSCKDPLVYTAISGNVVTTEIFDGISLVTLFCDVSRDKSFVHTTKIYVSDVYRFMKLDSIFNGENSVE